MGAIANEEYLLRTSRVIKEKGEKRKTHDKREESKLKRAEREGEEVVAEDKENSTKAHQG